MFLLLLLTLSQDAPPAAVSLTISTDVAARLELDGQSVGQVDPGTPLRVETRPGDHQLTATPNDGGPTWRKQVFLTSAVPANIAIPLRSHLLRTEIQKAGYWRDPRTKLIWAAADSGSGLTWSQANTYCRALTSGGFHDWRLPDIEEAQTLFGGFTLTADERGFRLVAPLKLSGWSWSRNQGREPAENWTLDLGDGARASVAAGDAGLNRALCVRTE